MRYDESKAAKLIGLSDTLQSQFTREFLQNDPEQIAAVIIGSVPKDKVRAITAALARQLITLKREGTQND